MMVMNTPDLIERLRLFEGSDALGNGDFSLCDEAADTLAQFQDALRTAVAWLREDNGGGIPPEWDALTSLKKGRVDDDGRPLIR